MKIFSKGTLVIFFTIVFNLFFWQEKFGINLILFSVLFSAILYYLNPDTRTKKQTLLAIFGIGISSFGILYHNSFFSKFMLFSSLFLLAASLMEKEIKTIHHLIPSGFLGIVTSPFRKHTFFTTPKTGFSGKSFKWLKLAAIPIVITIVFIVIYSSANPVFADKLNYIVDNLGDYFANLLEHYPFSRFIFIAIGLILGIGVFYYQSLGLFDENEKSHKPNLERKKTPFKSPTSAISKPFSMVALKTENSIAILTLVSLNALLFFVNLLDINVFLVQDHALNSDYSSQLHKGTWILIFSIILSGAIVLYIFRRNLNFYKNNSLLKLVTYIWIGQNILLTTSVIARVYYYISHHGLAYKRIGVLIFVTATIIGLFTLGLKVKNKKTVSYLFRINGVSIFGILLMSSIFNWDIIIAEHNLANAQTKKIDYLFELSLSDKTLPILSENRDKLKLRNNNYKNYSFDFPWVKNMSLTEKLDERIKEFKTKQAKRSWLSWNFYDHKTAEYFKSSN